MRVLFALRGRLSTGDSWTPQEEELETATRLGHALTSGATRANWPTAASNSIWLDSVGRVGGVGGV